MPLQYEFALSNMQLLLLFVPLQVLLIDSYVKALDVSIIKPRNTYSLLAISAPVCIDPPHAQELDLEPVNYRDCIPLLNDILLEPNVNDQNQYNATDAGQGRFFRTCSIALRPRLTDVTDVFWGYQIAIAAATAVKGCVEDSVDPYGGLVFTTSTHCFYAQVKNPSDLGSVETFSTVPSEKHSFEDKLLLANSTNATLLIPDRMTAIPTCQISQVSNPYLYPVKVLDCYYLFYKILTTPIVERSITLRGLSPIRNERYGTCTLQLRGFSAVSADAIKYVSLLLGAVSIVQTCVVASKLVFGGAISVGSRGQYFVRVFNLVEERAGEVVHSEQDQSM